MCFTCLVQHFLEHGNANNVKTFVCLFWWLFGGMLKALEKVSEELCAWNTGVTWDTLTYYITHIALLSPQIRLGWSEDFRNEAGQDSVLLYHVLHIQKHSRPFMLETQIVFVLVVYGGNIWILIDYIGEICSQLEITVHIWCQLVTELTNTNM